MIESPFSTTPNVILDLLKKIRPFSDLDPGVLERLASMCVIDFFPKGTIIVERGAKESRYFHFVQKGAIKRYAALNGHEIIAEISGEGCAFDAPSIIRRQKPDFTIETIEDTFCFLLQREDFLNLAHSCPSIVRYYLDAFSNERLRCAYHELKSEKMRARKPESFFLFNQRLQDMIISLPETISSSLTIKDAALRMAALDSSSLLVEDDSKSVVGIITDQDLRSKVIALGVDASANVRVGMTSPVPIINSNLTCFDALMEIMMEDVDHLAVEDRGRIIGVVSAREIMAAQGASPLLLFREVSNQRDARGLNEISRRIPLVVRNLVEGDARAPDIYKIITALTDRILIKLLELAQLAVEPAPEPFSWITFGPEGRCEQDFETEHYHAFIYRDPQDEEGAQTADRYFAQLADMPIARLFGWGKVLSGDSRLSVDGRWRKPYSVLRGYFDSWIAEPAPKQAVSKAIFFDYRVICGDCDLAESLREYIFLAIQRHPGFLRGLAEDFVTSQPPLSFFRDLVVEKTGDRQRGLNLKLRGIKPIVDFARILSLKHGIKHTNTLARLRSLCDAEVIQGDFFAEIKESYEFQMQMVLIHQLEKVESGSLPNDFVFVANLLELEKHTLKETFRLINEMIAFIRSSKWL